jgi:hypothetical protein
MWQPISTPGVNGWTASTAIDSLATAKSNANTIYATTGGHIFVTFDDGQHWAERDVSGFTDHFRTLAVDPRNNMVAYAVRDRFTPSSLTGHVFMTTNGGMSWKDISGNLPNSPTNAIVLDPRTNILYVGNDLGVYASIDGGASWARFKPGFPVVQVVQLQLNPYLNILAAGTHGRGMWEIAVAHFQVTPSSSTVQTGKPFSITVTALDPFNRTITSYNHKVHFVSTDHQASLPGDFTFSPTNGGMHTFMVTLGTAGSQIVRVSDVNEPAVTGTATLTITGPAVASLAASAEPSALYALAARLARKSPDHTALDALFSAFG